MHRFNGEFYLLKVIPSEGPFLRKLCSRINNLRITKHLFFDYYEYLAINSYTFSILYLFSQHFEIIDLLYFKSGASSLSSMKPAIQPYVCVVIWLYIRFILSKNPVSATTVVFLRLASVTLDISFMVCSNYLSKARFTWSLFVLRIYYSYLLTSVAVGR